MIKNRNALKFLLRTFFSMLKLAVRAAAFFLCRELPFSLTRVHSCLEVGPVPSCPSWWFSEPRCCFVKTPIVESLWVMSIVALH